MALLGVPRKRTGRLNLQGVVMGWLRQNRGPHIYNSEAALASLDEAQRLRDFAFEPLGPMDAVREKLLRYFGFLTALEAALPVGTERNGIPVIWSWQEAFADNRIERSLVAFEKSAVLFLLATQLATTAAAEKLETDASCKNAAKRLQEAAALFEWLHVNVPLKFDFNGMVDLSPPTTAFLSALCLAQAQEATYVKAALDGKSPALLSRIALQAHIMYSDSRSCLGPDSQQLARAVGKPLAAHLATKAALLGASSWHHAAAAAEALDDCGQRLGCLREAAKQLAIAKQAAGGQKVHPSLPVRVSEEAVAVASAMATAQRENDTVYLQRVPPADALIRGDPALLVKSAPLPTEMDANDDRWFAFLSISAPDPLPQQEGGGGLGGLLGAMGRAVFR